ncbi:MAG: hypothetical protein CMN77_17655 [Spirochaetaceae bacterium]|nr:hypothetical protein [Spirochaetaceae bacterium]
MTRVRPLEIIRFFYSTSLDHIPLVRDLDGRLEGYLSRNLLNRELSDLERAQAEYESVPEAWVRPDIDREELLKLSSQCPVPVVNRAGLKKTEWQDTELLRNASELKERKAREEAEAAEVINPEPETSDQWFARLVLAAIPHPILATDLNGHALFYNEGFQQRVLERDFFHKNLALAESYFLELTRGLLARVYSEGPHPTDLLFASIPELSISVEITTIHREQQVSGYLYIFQDPELSGIPHEVLSRLERGMSLDEIMEELEAGIIASMLRRNGQNVSHAAQALRINRSTLQNKIKRLKVNERYARKVDGPVRRVRGTRAESDAAEQESAVPPSESAPARAKKAGSSTDKKSTKTSTRVPQEKGSGEKSSGKSRATTASPAPKKTARSSKKSSKKSKKSNTASSKKAVLNKKTPLKKKTASSNTSRKKKDADS